MNLKSLVLAAVVLGCFVYFLPCCGWYPVAGASMQPLLPAFGGICHVDTSRAPRPGDVIVFRLPGRNYPMVKRAAAIASGGYIWTVADNKGVTGEDSDHYGWVHPDFVIATVTSVYSLKRIVRMLTPHGRFLNWLDLRVGKARCHWSLDRRYVAVEGDGCVAIYSYNGTRIGTRRGEFSCWWSRERLALVRKHHHPLGTYRTRVYADVPGFVVRPFPPRTSARRIPGYRAIRHIEFLDGPAGESWPVQVEGRSWCRVQAPAPIVVRCEGRTFDVEPGKLVSMDGSFTLMVPESDQFDFICSEAHDNPLVVDVYIRDDGPVPIEDPQRIARHRPHP